MEIYLNLANGSLIILTLFYFVYFEPFCSFSSCPLKIYGNSCSDDLEYWEVIWTSRFFWDGSLNLLKFNGGIMPY